MDDPPGARALSGPRLDAHRVDVRPLDAGGLVPDGLDATLLLLRHGESTYVAEGRFQGRADVPLSSVGRRQAELSATRLARPHASPALPVPLGTPLEIVHSPLARAVETAVAAHDAIVAAGGAPAAARLRADAGFEEIAQGEWEGRTGAEIQQRWGETLSVWRRRPTEAWAPGGESLGQVQDRVRPALARLLAPMAEGRTPGTRDRDQVLGYGQQVGDQPWSVLVAHDGIFKVVLLTLFELPLERFWTFSFSLCGISVVEFRGGRATLRAHNLTEHLAPLLDERAQAEAEARERTGAL